ncbi:PIN domain nuclease [Fusibacter paucivorans]|uniref:PIN domain nuclease n=1 Tax=Fusibacter paucivorans TaxID=76009 RepID=A0ABS5PT64_9FIRM|nr:PIN domain-containing protein [Fusibacter paucivorans]MBS7528368.1 PIN domain nuclease [Fusibacter paucivorans]
MVERIIKYILTFVGLCIGIGLGIYLTDFLPNEGLFNLSRTVYVIAIPTILGLILAFITYFTSQIMISVGKKSALLAQNELEKIPPHELAFGMIGLIFGLVIAFLISGLYEIIPIPMVANALKILTFIFFGYLGIMMAQKNIKDQSKLQDWARKLSIIKSPAPAAPKHAPVVEATNPKVLDTSVIIDGRISDICKTGFIEGPIIIPEFVLKELRHIADSSDALKRNRGRRGLDILKIIQKDLPIEVQIVGTDFEDVDEVDLKLIKLAQKIKGSIVTNDYNLNKVATLQDIQILNINELANAVKPVVLPGEEMVVQIIKEGKESNQGIAYLDDGTMIVVEEGKRFINETIHVIVTSVLQTAAGRMIFAKHK